MSDSIYDSDYAALSLERALYYAIKYKHNDMVKNLLDEGIDPNSLMQNGNTWSFCAAWNGNLEALKILRSYGANINAPGSYNHYFLIAGVMHHNILKYVLETVEDVDVNVSEALGITPLLQATHFETRGNTDSISDRIASMRLLVAKGAKVNAQSVAGVSPLMGACISQSPRLIAVLIELGADPGLVDREGKTAYDYLNDELKSQIGHLLSTKACQ